MTENGPSPLDGCLQPLLESLDTLLAIQRHLNPVFLKQLKKKATVRAAPLQEGREALAALDVTDDLKSVLDTSFELAEKAIAAFGRFPGHFNEQADATRFIHRPLWARIHPRRGATPHAR